MQLCGQPLDGNGDGCSVEAGLLDAHSNLPCSEQGCRMHEVSCYCGPNIGCQFLSQVCFVSLTFSLQKPHSCTGPTALKTHTFDVVGYYDLFNSVVVRIQYN